MPDSAPFPSHVSSRLIACVLAILAICCTFVVKASDAEAAPSLGVNIVTPFDPVQLSEVEALGARRVRAFVMANAVQTTPGGPLTPSFMTGYTTFVNRMHSRGIAVDFVVMGTPGGATNIAPANPDVFANFMAQFAGAFPGKGVAYEIWNEPDEAAFWAPAPSAAAYAALLKRTYPAIKRVDPTATVIAGATTGNNFEWISQLYAQGIKGSFDAAAVHTDTACLVAAPSEFYRENNRIGRYSFLGYKEVRNTMMANGDDKPIWMTEFGWSSTGGIANSCRRGIHAGKKRSGVTEAQQAEFLTQAVRCMSADPYLQVADWFVMRDDPSQAEPELRHYGLLRSGGGHKPSYDQMQGLLRGSVASTGSCADLWGPEIEIQKPTANQKFKGVLKLKVSVSDPSGIKGIRYYRGTKKFTSVNKAAVVNSGKPISTRWFGAQCLKKGKVRIKIVAIDKLGNKEFEQVVVKKTDKANKKSKTCKKKKKKKKKK